MSDYQFKGAGAALPYGAFGQVVLQKRVDVLNLIATDFDKLALTSAPTVGLTSFAGFVAADTLEIFSLPAGTLVDMVGIRIKTVGTGSATISIGDDTQAAGWIAASTPLDAAVDTTVITVKGDNYGSTSMEAKVYTSADGIDITFAGTTNIIGSFDVFALATRVFS